MLVTHVHLIIIGKTTVETFAGRDQTEMENSVLHREFGFMWRDHSKRQVRKRWKEEFGGVEVDERWQVGTWTDRWRTEMGDSRAGWIRESSVLRAVADKEYPLDAQKGTVFITRPTSPLVPTANGSRGRIGQLRMLILLDSYMAR